MNTKKSRGTVLSVALLGALLFPWALAAQVQEARVRIDGMT